MACGSQHIFVLFAKERYCENLVCLNVDIAHLLMMQLGSSEVHMRTGQLLAGIGDHENARLNCMKSADVLGGDHHNCD